MFVNKHSDFLALGFLTGVDVIGTLGLLSMTSYEIGRCKYIAPFDLPKTTELPPVGKEYLCFQINRKSPHAAQCVKSRILNKAIDSILSIDTFMKQCVVIKCMLQ